MRDVCATPRHGRDGLLLTWDLERLFPGALDEDDDGVGRDRWTEGAARPALAPPLSAVSTGCYSFCAAVALPDTPHLILSPGEAAETVHLWDARAPAQPSPPRTWTVAPSVVATGMAMAVRVAASAAGLVVGYEAGHVAMFDLGQSGDRPLALAQLHPEPRTSRSCCVFCLSLVIFDSRHACLVSSVLALGLSATGTRGLSGSAERHIGRFTLDWSLV